MLIIPPPLIEFHQAQFDPLVVTKLIDLSREIMRKNRNHGAKWPIALLTDSLDLAHLELAERNCSHKAIKTVTKNGNQFVGYCWHADSAKILWIDPKRPQRESVKTLCHEVAHAFTRGQHEHVWRRAYSMLLPLYIHTLYKPLPADAFEKKSLIISSVSYKVNTDIKSVVNRYASRSSYTRITHEIIGHLAASDRVWNAWCDELLKI